MGRRTMEVPPSSDNVQITKTTTTTQGPITTQQQSMIVRKRALPIRILLLIRRAVFGF